MMGLFDIVYHEAESLAAKKVPEIIMARVSLIKGHNRREITRKSLELVSDDIERGLVFRQPVIKPNFVSPTIQLASSHADQMRGILDFLSPIYRGTILIAGCDNMREAFTNFGYTRLLNEYNVELIDLNQCACETYCIPGADNQPVPVRLSRLLMDRENYIISAAKMKTHDCVVVTLSVKNMAVGCILKGDKSTIHQGAKRMNLIIAELAGLVWPDLAVIDGFEGMEGDGPSHGDPVDLGIGIASVDALAADRVGCEIMGVNFHDVGYLHYCAEQCMGEADPGRIEVLGERVGDCIRPFKLHRSVREQYAWKE
jgi:uncharacterized protein (DUF362 family)